MIRESVRTCERGLRKSERQGKLAQGNVAGKKNESEADRERLREKRERKRGRGLVLTPLLKTESGSPAGSEARQRTLSLCVHSSSLSLHLSIHPSIYPSR